MTQLELQLDITEYVAQGAFFAAILFSLVYIPFFQWRETWTGRAAACIGPGVFGALLRTVLIIWGVPIVTITRTRETEPWYGSVLTWLSIVCIGMVGISLIIFTVEAVTRLRQHPEDTVLAKLDR